MKKGFKSRWSRYKLVLDITLERKANGFKETTYIFQR